MTREELELTTIEIVAFAGDARTKYIEAMNAATDGEFDKAEKLIEEGNDCIQEAHKVQTNMIQMEARGEKVDVSFLMVHAQDHLMTVMLLRDVVKGFLKLSKKCN
ncbi:PTS lactose/cellobiose transporter subunit IIA [Clostridium sp. HBUAS56017]|uniref:PTS lactose/cellobiose transporter subunit IIA n=1 Tax=Clostridium sp. HBUAS56017 TaxID=2571128 RepID=UPI001177C848|nr:PTS lactose/cellobiose transporter subunit IIA [Clostridium sp. HBUAS56017]